MTLKPTDTPAGYNAWLAELKIRIGEARLRASLAVNAELIGLYWRIGQDILERQERDGWGARVVDRLAADLRAAFPGMRGFSRANLLYMRAFAEAWPDPAIVQRVVGQLPWGQNIELDLMGEHRAAPAVLKRRLSVPEACGRLLELGQRSKSRVLK